MIYSNRDYTRIVRPLPGYVERDAYGIPVIEPEPIDISNINNGKWLTNIANATAHARHRKSKIVHCFSYDDTLWRQYNNPWGFLQRVGDYYAVSSMDFSMDENMTVAQVIGCTFQNRWSGAFLQVNGKRTIPTVGWTVEELDDISFSGLRDGGVFIISSMSVRDTAQTLKTFLRGYLVLRERFPNTQIICVGDFIPGMDHDICFVKYKESFGSWDRHPGAIWQPSLFNWDGSVANLGGM